MFKRKFGILIAAVGAAFALCACSGNGGTDDRNSGQITQAVNENKSSEASGAGEKSEKNVVVTTSFLQDMVEQIAGDTVDIKLIIPAGEDPHLYVAKPEDYTKLSEADLTLYHGLHFEGKMVEALEATGEAVSRNFPEDKIGTMDENGAVIVDPHFWFDIDLYKMAVEAASESLENLNPGYKDMYEKQKTKYIEELTELDNYVRENISSIPKESRYLITPHDAFNYFSRAYDIEVKAPQGVSTESEVANQDIQETIDFIVEHKIKAIFAESTTDPARMEKLREGAAAKGADVKIVKGEGNELFSDSLAPKGQDGDTYIDMYKHNVKLITDNLK